MTEAVSMIEGLRAAGGPSAMGVVGIVPPTPPTPPTVVRFENDVVKAIQQVETQHAMADSALADLASGDNVDLHSTMIELEKADIALRTMVSVRDRFISAYEQVMNMTV